MVFDLLIEDARRDNCSDVHITVGTAIARRRFSKLELLYPVPSAEDSDRMILEDLTEEQKA